MQGSVLYSAVSLSFAAAAATPTSLQYISSFFAAPIPVSTFQGERRIKLKKYGQSADLYVRGPAPPTPPSRRTERKRQGPSLSSAGRSVGGPAAGPSMQSEGDPTTRIGTNHFLYRPLARYIRTGPPTDRVER